MAMGKTKVSRVLIIWFTIVMLPNGVDLQNTKLIGQHIVVTGVNSFAGFNMIRNASGHIVLMDGTGAYILDWLAQRYSFTSVFIVIGLYVTYSALQVNDTALDRSGNQPGLISYLLKGDCQMLISLAPTASRTSFLDFSHPTLYLPVSFIIRNPEYSLNIEAILRSFRKEVWVALIVSIPCIVLVLHFLERNVDFTYRMERDAKERKESWKSVSIYVFGVLFSQGSYIPRKTSPFYITAGVWCVATFILINAYNCNLISHLCFPAPQPLITSIYDLRDQPNVKLVTDRNMNTDAVLSAAEAGFLKVLGDKLRSYPNSRCNATKQCVNLVKSGSHVYTSGINYFLYGALREDFRSTGQCNLYLEKQSFLNLYIAWATQKRSSYMDILNYGFMQMREMDLLDHWNKNFQPDAHQCLAHNRKKEIRSLRFKDLTGAFTVLLIGSLLSLVTFIGEKIMAVYNNRY